MGKKPGLVIFAAVYLFISAAFIGILGFFATLPLVVFSSSSGSTSQSTSRYQIGLILLFAILFIALICAPFIASGIGLLNRKKWARVTSIIIFSLSILGGFVSITSQNNSSSGTQSSQSLGKALGLALPGLGLYAMTLSQTVQNYFSRGENASYYRTESDTQGNLRLNLSLDFYEAILGCEKKIQFNRLEAKSDGQVMTGTKTLQISVPAGVEPGAHLQITGEGDVNYDSGEPGNLSVYLSVPLEEGKFRRDGINIVSEMRIAAEQARTGGEVSVNVVGGKAILVIPPETKNGDFLTLKGCGVARLNSDEKGDHIIQVSVA